MYISREDKEYLIRELQVELHARLDGGRKNIIVPECVWCGKTGGKLGIYVGPEKYLAWRTAFHAVVLAKTSTVL